jgi:putative transposase
VVAGKRGNDRDLPIVQPYLKLGQNLLLHRHIHCVIPAGGLALDRKSPEPCLFAASSSPA